MPNRNEEFDMVKLYLIYSLIVKKNKNDQTHGKI